MTNGDFENGVTSWQNWGGSTAATTTGQHSGNGALSILAAGGGRAQDVTASMIVGATYTVNAYAMLGALGENSSINVDVYDSTNTRI